MPPHEKPVNSRPQFKSHPRGGEKSSSATAETLSHRGRSVKCDLARMMTFPKPAAGGG
jgi:hypothetical protein